MQLLGARFSLLVTFIVFCVFCYNLRWPGDQIILNEQVSNVV